MRRSFGGVQGAGGDLLVDGGGAVAELRGADGDVVRPVGQEGHAGVGVVPAGRAGRDHRHGRALPDQPALGGLLGAGVLGDRLAHDPQALVEAVRGDVEVLLLADRAEHVLAGADDVLLPEDQRVHAETASQLVHDRFDGEGDLAEAVTAEGARRDDVRVDGERVDLLVRGAVDGERLADAVEHDGGAVVAVGAGVGDDAHLDRGQSAVGAGAGLDADGEGVACGRSVELLRACVLQLHRLPQFQRRQRDDVLRQHLLLAAKAAAHAPGDDAHLVLGQPVQGAQGAARQERGLGGGADGEAFAGAVLLGLEVGDAAVGLQAGVLDALRAEGLLVDDVGVGEAVRDGADLAVHFAGDVVLHAGDPHLGALALVDDGGAGGHRLLRVGDVRELFVDDFHPAAAFLGGLFAVGDHGGDALADVADGVVEDAGVVGVLGGVLVTGRGVQVLRSVLVGEDGVHAGHAQGRPSRTSFTVFSLILRGTGRSRLGGIASGGSGAEYRRTGPEARRAAERPGDFPADPGPAPRGARWERAQQGRVAHSGEARGTRGGSSYGCVRSVL